MVFIFYGEPKKHNLWKHLYVPMADNEGVEKHFKECASRIKQRIPVPWSDLYSLEQEEIFEVSTSEMQNNELIKKISDYKDEMIPDDRADNISLNLVRAIIFHDRNNEEIYVQIPRVNKSIEQKKFLMFKEKSWQFLNDLDFLPINDFLDAVVLKDKILFFKRTNLGFLNIFDYCYSLSKSKIEEKLLAKKIKIDPNPEKKDIKSWKKFLSTEELNNDSRLSKLFNLPDLQQFIQDGILVIPANKEESLIFYLKNKVPVITQIFLCTKENPNPLINFPLPPHCTLLDEHAIVK